MSVIDLLQFPSFLYNLILTASPNTFHGVIFPTMPPPRNITSNPASDRLHTRSGNANVHHGTAAQVVLRVNAPCCDPAIIQKEKDAAKEKKAMRLKAKETNQARNEATKSMADEFRAHQASKQVNEEVEMPHKTSKGRVLILSIT